MLEPREATDLVFEPDFVTSIIHFVDHRLRSCQLEVARDAELNELVTG